MRQFNWVIITPGNGLSSAWTHANLLSIIIKWKLNFNTNIFFKQNAIYNVVCKMATVLSPMVLTSWKLERNRVKDRRRQIRISNYQEIVRNLTC